MPSGIEAETAPPEGSLNIRYPDLDDLMDLYALQKRGFPEDGFSVTLLRKLLNYNELFLILEDARAWPARMLGFVIVVADHKDKHVELAGRVAHIVNFVIDPIVQRQGHGTFLLELVLRGLAPEFDWACLEVKTTNAAALALYERHGFRVVHTIKEYYQSGADCHVMVRRFHHA